MHLSIPWNFKMGNTSMHSGFPSWNLTKTAWPIQKQMTIADSTLDVQLVWFSSLKTRYSVATLVTVELYSSKARRLLNLEVRRQQLAWVKTTNLMMRRRWREFILLDTWCRRRELMVTWRLVELLEISCIKISQSFLRRNRLLRLIQILLLGIVKVTINLLWWHVMESGIVFLIKNVLNH